MPTKIHTARGAAMLPDCFIEVPALEPDFVVYFSAGVVKAALRVSCTLEVTLSHDTWSIIGVAYDNVNAPATRSRRPDAFIGENVLQVALTEVLTSLKPGCSAFLFGSGVVPGRIVPLADRKYRELFSISPLLREVEEGLELIAIVVREDPKTTGVPILER